MGRIVDVARMALRQLSVDRQEEKQQIERTNSGPLRVRLALSFVGKIVELKTDETTSLYSTQGRLSNLINRCCKFQPILAQKRAKIVSSR